MAGKSARPPPCWPCRQTSRQAPLSQPLWPRRKQEAAPDVAWFGSGRGVQVSSQAGVSYLSLAGATRQISPDQQARFTGEALPRRRSRATCCTRR
ncbi:MAG UNVERIFIED_CONTAM: hypothetical protein LVR18_48465 [Planctomycetaceae bacterium]